MKTLLQISIAPSELWFWKRLLRVPWTARDPTSPSRRRSVLCVHWKDWCWCWNYNTLATWCKELTRLKRPWRWERLRAGGYGDDRRWDGWMASPTRWTWVLVSSGSWWWTGMPCVLWFMESQRVGHDCVTALNWIIKEIPVCAEYLAFVLWNPVYASLCHRRLNFKDYQQASMPLVIGCVLPMDSITGCQRNTMCPKVIWLQNSLFKHDLVQLIFPK